MRQEKKEEEESLALKIAFFYKDGFCIKNHEGWYVIK